VIVNAPNPQKKLMPGMTANITVLVEKIDSVLIIPGRAMRFTPDANFLAEYFKKNFPGRRQGPQGQERQRTTIAGTDRSVNPFQNTQSSKRPVAVWVKSAELVHRVPVTTGATDASNIEIKSGLKEGDVVILSMTRSGTSAAVTATPATSPFMPQRGRR
jgi:HlyD family secretion protein